MRCRTIFAGFILWVNNRQVNMPSSCFATRKPRLIMNHFISVKSCIFFLPLMMKSQMISIPKSPNLGFSRCCCCVLAGACFCDRLTWHTHLSLASRKVGHEPNRTEPCFEFAQFPTLVGLMSDHHRWQGNNVPG